MAQPPPYVRRYDFVSFQTLNPKTPLPAQQHENEYNAILQSLNQTITNIGLIQRDDGELANGSVGWDQLDDEVVVGISQPYNWIALNQYSVGDMVYAPSPNSSKIYRCVVAHISSSDFDADLAAGNWTLQIDFANATSEADAAAAAAEAALDEFTDIYLGVFASPPTLDNDGDPLQTGALYFDSVLDEMRVYNGTAWQWAGQSGTSGVSSWNGRIGIVSLTYDDITAATTADPLATDAELSAAIGPINSTLATKADKTYVDSENDAQDTATQSALDLKVPQTGPTGAALIPAGTTAQQPGSPLAGYLRFNSTTGKYEGHNGTAWAAIGGGASIGTVPPANPGPGDLWWNSELGILFVYYADVDTSQWVSTSPAVDPTLYYTKTEIDALNYTKAQSDARYRGSAFQAHMSAVQSISNTGQTKVNFDTVAYDADGSYDTVLRRFTPKVAGLYLVNASIAIPGGTYVASLIYKNGTGVRASSLGINDPYVSGTTGLVVMNGTTDYVECWCQYAGGNNGLPAGNSSLYNFFEAAMIRGA